MYAVLDGWFVIFNDKKYICICYNYSVQHTDTIPQKKDNNILYYVSQQTRYLKVLIKT